MSALGRQQQNELRLIWRESERREKAKKEGKGIREGKGKRERGGRWRGRKGRGENREKESQRRGWVIALPVAPKFNP